MALVKANCVSQMLGKSPSQGRMIARRKEKMITRRQGKILARRQRKILTIN